MSKPSRTLQEEMTMPDCTRRHRHLDGTDPEMFALLERQVLAESTTLKMIPSENFASFAVLEASGSILDQQVLRGIPRREVLRRQRGRRRDRDPGDRAGQVALRRRARQRAALFRLARPTRPSTAPWPRPGDKFMGMPVPEGGHLTHGWRVSFSGIDYVQVPYGPNPETGVLDYDKIREIARKHRPRMIWVGATAYPRSPRLRQVRRDRRRGRRLPGGRHRPHQRADHRRRASQPGALLRRRVAAPATRCSAARGPGSSSRRSRTATTTSTTRKSKFNLAKRIDRAVFPGIQGGPHMQTIAAMAVAFKEAATEEFRQYGRQVVEELQAPGRRAHGPRIPAGQRRDRQPPLDDGLPQDRATPASRWPRRWPRRASSRNFNMVPGDHRKPTVTSGVRMGTPALTSMGMKEPEMDRDRRLDRHGLPQPGRPRGHGQESPRRSGRALLPIPHPGYPRRAGLTPAAVARSHGRKSRCTNHSPTASER